MRTSNPNLRSLLFLMQSHPTIHTIHLIHRREIG